MIELGAPGGAAGMAGPAMVGMQLGSWRLTRLLGAGGMGSVYLAEHVGLGSLWAVKVLSPELSQHAGLVQRFINEARAAASVTHRNLIRVVHIDQLPNDGPWYMVLDYLQGVTLGRFIAQQPRPVPPHFAVRLLAQIGNALEALHRREIVHRDVKADNVFIVRRDKDDHVPILLDLGIAWFGGGLGTQRGAVIGTPCCMPPEQLLGEQVGPQADVYALGVLAYQIATGGYFPHQMDGEAAYVQLPPAELYRRQAADGPIDPRRRNAGISDAFAAVIYRMLDRDVKRRFPTAQEAVLELAKAVPTDGLAPDGLQILREYASDLVAADDLLSTHRSRPSFLSSPSSEGGRYVVGDRLGAGGMAEVFTGSQIGERGFERPVAIKRVLTGLLAQPGFEEMFVSEARTAARLKHPNIVDVIDLRKDDENRLFIVMEYVDGTDLARLLAAGLLPASTVIYVTAEILRGLGYAHDRVDPVSGTRGVVHRDVSPQNVLISRAGEVKVSDFGLARALDGNGRAASATVRGKPAYMSPEQAQGKFLDGRSDLWAVGVMLWEMLAGRPLFRGTAMEVIGQVAFRDIELPSSVREGVPSDLETIAMRLLQRDANARYAKAEDAITDLLRCADVPVSGRDELIAHVAMRFPVSANTALSASAPLPVPSRFQVPGRATVSQLPRPQSTLASAASESRPSRPRSDLKMRTGRNMWVLAAMLAGGLAAVVARGRVVTMDVPPGSTPSAATAVPLTSSVPVDAMNGNSAFTPPHQPYSSRSEDPESSHRDALFQSLASLSTDAGIADAIPTTDGVPSSNSLATHSKDLASNASHASEGIQPTPNPGLSTERSGGRAQRTPNEGDTSPTKPTVARTHRREQAPPEQPQENDTFDPNAVGGREK